MVMPLSISRSSNFNEERDLHLASCTHGNFLNSAENREFKTVTIGETI